MRFIYNLILEFRFYINTLKITIKNLFEFETKVRYYLSKFTTLIKLSSLYQ